MSRPAAPSSDGRPTVVLVAAVARNGVIGADGGMPWHLPADLKRFKRLTMGHPMVMGRKTFESMGLLPGRRSIVITRDPTWHAPGTEIADSLETAIALATEGDQLVMVVGGGQVYARALARADRLEITHLDLDADGDTMFPDIDPALWVVAEREQADGYAWVTYVRRRPVTDLDELIRSMRPELLDGELVYCTVAGAVVPPGVQPVAIVREAEGLTLVLPVEQAAAVGLSGTFRCRQITLRVQSALDAVGLTAAFATALGNEGISCNVVAGFHHDHLFVPVADAERAISALEALRSASLAHPRYG